MLLLQSGNESICPGQCSPHPWNRDLLYTFSPLPLLFKVLLKIDRAHVIVIAPTCPRQTWYPYLGQLSCVFTWFGPLPSGFLKHVTPVSVPHVWGKASKARYFWHNQCWGAYINYKEKLHRKFLQ